MKRDLVAAALVADVAVAAIASLVAGEQKKVTLCHKGQATITVAESAAAAHSRAATCPARALRPCQRSLTVR